MFSLFRRSFFLSRVAATPKKFKLKAKHKGTFFPEGFRQTPRITRSTTPNFLNLEKMKEMINAPYVKDLYKSTAPRKHLVQNVPGMISAENHSVAKRKRDVLFRPKPRLPLTFEPGQDFMSWKKALMAPEPPLTRDPAYYPYTYYRVEFIRSLIGLSKSIKLVAKSIGYLRTHQVIYLRVNNKNAGKLLKLKELIRIQLVNHVPMEKQKAVLGYTVAGNVIGDFGSVRMQ
jgi:large subunit ribosomal protein L30